MAISFFDSKFDRQLKCVRAIMHKNKLVGSKAYGLQYQTSWKHFYPKVVGKTIVIELLFFRLVYIPTFGMFIVTNKQYKSENAFT